MSRYRLAAIAAAAAVRAVLVRPSVRRVQAAYLVGFIVDSALLVILAVTAYGLRGPAGVAGVGVARVAATVVFGLLAATPLSRWRADRVLRAIAFARAAAIAGAAIGVGFDGGIAWLLAVAAAAGASDAVLRPAQSTLLPALASTPEELATSNLASSTAEAVGSFVGPLVAAAFLAIGSPLAACLVLVLAQAVGIAALANVQFEDRADERGPDRTAMAGGLGLRAGLDAIWNRPALAVIIAGFGLQTMVRGLLTTLTVVLGIEVLRLGEAGVGMLAAAMGIGGMAGIVVGLALRRGNRLVFVVSLAGWGAPIALMGLVPEVGVAMGAFVLIGLSNAILDVVGYTLLQRGCRNHERAAVFALFEGTTAVLSVAGYLAGPAIIVAFGIRAALVATGLVLPIAAVAIRLLLDRSTEIEGVPWAVIERLRHVPAFRVLPLTGLERLVAGAVPAAFSAGTVLMTKGDTGREFLVIETGQVEVTDEGRFLDVLGPGAGLGEIALMSSGPRTATVTALTDVTALSFDGGNYLAAISGPAATAATTRLMEERLARSAAP